MNTTNTTTVRTEFRGGAAQLLSSKNGEAVLAGPAGTGKSRVMLTKLLTACLMRPGTRCLIVRKTARSLGSTTLVTWREEVAAEAISAGLVRFYSGSMQEASSYKFTNGSVIVLGGMDDATKVMSSAYDLIAVDEATELKESEWNALITRLRHGNLSYHQILGACNPGPPTHWIVKRSRTTLQLLTSQHTDNPAYYTPDGAITDAGADYLSRLQSLTGVQRERLLYGHWAAAEGVIYTEFNAARHIIESFPVPGHWPRYISVDFGYIHPFVAQWWAVDPDGRAVMYREIYHTRRLVEDHARDIARLSAGEDITAVVCDHHSENRASLERHLDMDTRPAHKSVNDGIEAVQSRLREQPDGLARMFFFSDALVETDPRLAQANLPTRTVEEFGSYVWNTAKAAPVKELDDGMDTCRYLVAELDLKRPAGITGVGGY